MRFFLFTFTILLLSAASHGQIRSLVAAEELLAKGDTTGAALVFQDILKRNPDSYTAALRLTEINFQRDILSEAIQYSHITEDILLRKTDSLKAQSEIDPTRMARYKADLSSLYFFKGKIRLKQRRGDDALRAFNRALKQGGDSAAILIDTGLAYLLESKPEAAKQSFLHSIKIRPDQPGAYFNLGNLYYNDNVYDSAEFYYSTCVRREPSFVQAHLMLGEINTRQKEYEEAIGNYSDYLRYKSSEEVYFKRAVLYAELRNWVRSLDNWDTVLILNPENGDAWRNRGLSNFQEQNYAAAISDFTQALEFDEDPYTYINRGYSYYLMGQTKEAIADYDIGLPQLPRYALGHYLRALAHYQRRKKRLACADLSKAMELGMEEQDMDKGLLGYCK